MTAPSVRDEPLCQEADSPTTPCRFWKHCHADRRRLQHYADLRGLACWAFQQLSERHVAADPVERAAIQGDG